MGAGGGVHDGAWGRAYMQVLISRYSIAGFLVVYL